MRWSFLLEPHSLPQIVRLFLICCLRCSSCQLGCPIILFSSCCFSSSPRCDRMSIRHLLALHTLLNSSSLPLLTLLCLADTVFVFVDPCFTRQAFLDNLSDSFSTFVVVWFDRSSMRCHLCTTRRTSSVIMSLKFSKHGKSSWVCRILSAGTLVRKMRSYFENEQSIFALLALQKSVFEIATVSMFTTNSDNCLFLFMLHIWRQLGSTPITLLWSVGSMVSRIPILQTCNVVVVLNQRLASFQHLRSSSL